MATFAALAAMLVALALFVFLGVVLPMALMMAIQGRQAVQDAPAHGGVILFVTLPVAALISIFVFLFLTIKLYRAGVSSCGLDHHQTPSTKHLDGMRRPVSRRDAIRSQ